jgi:hypothetical protein
MKDPVNGINDLMKDPVNVLNNLMKEKQIRKSCICKKK